MEPVAGCCLGAEVRGVDVRSPLPSPVLTELRQALLRHRVLAFAPECTGTGADGSRGLSEEQLVAWFAQFATPLAQDGRKGSAGQHCPEVFWVTNIHPSGSTLPTSPFLSDSELQLHSDLSYRAQPGSLSALYAVEVPESGGTTLWADGVAACEALAPELKARLAGRHAVHRHTEPHMNVDGVVTHPCISVHPETGEEVLFVSPMFTPELAPAESAGPGQEEEDEKTLAAAIGALEDPAVHYVHSWRPGQLVIWDNRSTAHRRERFEGRRMLWRTQSRVGF